LPFQQLTPRHYERIAYVLAVDIIELHGREWHNKFKELFSGDTGIVVPANHPSHKRRAAQLGIFYDDYERFANVIDFGVPTFWD